MISVVVATYNRCEMLRDLLCSFFEQEGLEEIAHEVLVIDNNSTDATKDVVLSFAHPWGVRYVNEEAQGSAHSRNRGITESRGDIIAFTDDDVIFSPRWLRELREGADRYPEASAFGGKAVAKWEVPKPKWFVDHGSFNMRGMISHFEPDLPEGRISICPFGCNMAFRAEVLRRSSGFRPELGPRPDAYVCGEETDLFQRFMADGHIVVYLPEAMLYHRVSRGRDVKSYYRRRVREYQRSVPLWHDSRRTEPPRSLWATLSKERWMGRQLAQLSANWMGLMLTGRWSLMFSRELAMRGLVEHARIRLASRSAAVESSCAQGQTDTFR